jgi:hypothetical protein
MIVKYIDASGVWHIFDEPVPHALHQRRRRAGVVAHQPTTRGHHARHPGLRGHSTGETYPFRVVWEGTLDSGSWVVVNGDRKWVGCTDPYRLARRLKLTEEKL